MDEPCSALDPTSTGRIEETIMELRNDVTVVIVTHNMQQARRVSDRCVFFLAAENEPGRSVIQQGSTEKMFDSPEDPRHPGLRPRQVWVKRPPLRLPVLAGFSLAVLLVASLVLLGGRERLRRERPPLLRQTVRVPPTLRWRSRSGPRVCKTRD